MPEVPATLPCEISWEVPHKFIGEDSVPYRSVLFLELQQIQACFLHFPANCQCYGFQLFHELGEMYGFKGLRAVTQSRAWV